MCGIAGLIDPGINSGDIKDTLKKMTDTMTYRGPDDEGFFASDGLGLGMRRLSIIDIAGGHQPISNEDGSIRVVFNGEIYNYWSLRKELVNRGHSFSTKSDTEAIVHLYEEQGIKCFDKLRGMFAIALWDHNKQLLLLARDRLGKKPLFYSRKDHKVYFASEIKAILAANPCLAEPEPGAVLPYFRYGFVPEPGTMFRHIKKLPAGSFLTYENGNIKIRRYWSLHFAANCGQVCKAADWVEELDHTLKEAVRLRLMSEAPLGIFLSGGLDSSTVVAYAHRAGLNPLKTFTVGFDRKKWDESADAALVARHFDTEHHVLTLREEDLARNLPETVLNLVRYFDEPFGDSSSLPTYYISQLARQHVTVILSGDGGDELFAGYPSYRGILFAERYRRLPQWLAAQLLPELAERLGHVLPAGYRYGALRAAKVLRDSSLPFEEMYFSKMALCPDILLKKLLGDHLLFGQFRQLNCSPDILAVMHGNTPILSRASYADIRFRLLDDMLVKVDRMSMANSLEVRSPFLDHCLVELAARIPPELKLRRWQTKAILRDTVRRYLPPATLRKPKQGFMVPLREWLRTGLRDMVGDYLEGPGGLAPLEMFNLATIRELIAKHYRGEADYSSIIWLLLNYIAWHHLYIGANGYYK
jgi:asparagine synthase (glutamine-hydrolysing)